MMRSVGRAAGLGRRRIGATAGTVFGLGFMAAAVFFLELPAVVVFFLGFPAAAFSRAARFLRPARVLRATGELLVAGVLRVGLVTEALTTLLATASGLGEACARSSLVWLRVFIVELDVWCL